jgi:hypothetical protein
MHYVHLELLATLLSLIVALGSVALVGTSARSEAPDKPKLAVRGPQAAYDLTDPRIERGGHLTLSPSRVLEC